MSRSSSRYRAHLTVRASDGRGFLAENLSRHGLFIKDATGLAVGQRITVDVDLSGIGDCRVTAEVAHVITLEAAASLGRAPGAGLTVIEWLDDAEDLWASYLRRLNRRGDVVVLAVDELTGFLLAAAGYQVAAAPAPGDLAQVIAASDVPIIAVVVPRERAAGYARAAGPRLPVIAVDNPGDIEPLLDRLDGQL
ncbi:MAG TPA: hypothetical protein VFG83_17990 [Kofleriaceae bacterium]|nr:hypothetical protein [Kofleriaceae bacterium]